MTNQTLVAAVLIMLTIIFLLAIIIEDNAV
jgi:hypothetical protein